MTQPRWMNVAGWALTGLVGLFLLADAAMKLVPLDVVLTAGDQLGFQGVRINRLLGVILMIATVLALLPRTALTGTILVTAYLGGAVAAQLRIGAPLGSHVLFGVYLGIALWLGLYLRSPLLRRMMPVRRGAER